MKPTSKAFPIAQTYPSFFNNNLNDPNRVIKILQGKYCSIRAFYYQLLKMVIELEVRRNGQEIDYSEIFFSKVQEMLSNLPKVPSSSYIKKYAEKVYSFVKELLDAEETHFQTYIDKNNDIDGALIAILEQMLRQGGAANSSVEETFAYLSELFNQRITQIQKCIKFEESDVFVYIENQNQLYLAFLRLDDEIQNQNNSIDKVISTQKEDSKEQYKNVKKVGKTQNDTIINIFGDMLHSSKNEGDSKVSGSFVVSNFNNSLSPKKEEQPLAQNKNIYISNNLPQLPIDKKDSVDDYIKTNDESKFMKNESRVQTYSMNQGNLPLGKDCMPDFPPYEDIIYRPSAKNYTLKTISQVSASRQSILQSQKKKKDILNWADQEEKGTFYRQFTDTRILNILPQPQRTTVRMLKNRFIGVHSSNFPHKF